MKKNGKDVSVVFIEEVLKTANVIGYKKTADFLIKLRKSHPEALQSECSEIVINDVLVEFNMSRDLLLSQKGDSRLARQFVYVLMQDFCKADPKYMSMLFKKDVGYIYREIKAFRKLDKNSRYDAQILTRYEKVSDTLSKKLTK